MVVCARLFTRATLLACCYAVSSMTYVDAFECGAALAPCGKAVPAGVTCPKGAGWCSTGHYCGYGKDDVKPTCLPLPNNCGKAGYNCCPSNAKTPHTSATYALDRRALCSDGSTCVYDPLEASTSETSDPYAGVQGYGCVAIPTNCGTTPNSPCCPSTYHMGYNPPLERSSCPENFFCQSVKGQGLRYPGSDLISENPGVCLQNAPDRGKVGKPCCISNGGSSTATKCVPAGGKQGYCATAAGLVYGKGGLEKDLVCKLCPAKVDAALKTSQSDIYRDCS